MVKFASFYQSPPSLMFTRILTRIFGSRNDRLIKRYNKTVLRINALEPAVSALTDDGLREKTAEFKQRLAQGEVLDDLLPEAFAVVREAGKGQNALRVQTEYLQVLPDRDLARTDRQVVITEGRSRLAGTGMELNNKTRQFALRSQVRGTFDAKK